MLALGKPQRQVDQAATKGVRGLCRQHKTGDVVQPRRSHGGGKAPGIDGIGFVLDAPRDGIVGFDLDGCRNPETGRIEGWATKIINGLLSYTEISPSGTGVKIFAKADPVPAFALHKVVVQKANGSGKDQAVEVYTNGQYFCLTGKILSGVPDEIVDATEAVERLSRWIAKQAGVKAGAGSGNLPRAFIRLLDGDETLRDAWRTAPSSAAAGTPVPAPWIGPWRSTFARIWMMAISPPYCGCTVTDKSAAELREGGGGG